MRRVYVLVVDPLTRFAVSINNLLIEFQHRMGMCIYPLQIKHHFHLYKEQIDVGQLTVACYQWMLENSYDSKKSTNIGSVAWTTKKGTIQCSSMRTKRIVQHAHVVQLKLSFPFKRGHGFFQTSSLLFIHPSFL